MPRFRNAANSFNEWLGHLFHASRARTNPRFGPGRGVTVAHQLYEFLRRRLVGAAGIAALLRHRAANSLGFRRIGSLGYGPTFDDRLAGVAGRAFVANNVALSHGDPSFVGV
jgi:hypothetical protein